MTNLGKQGQKMSEELEKGFLLQGLGKIREPPKVIHLKSGALEAAEMAQPVSCWMCT